ncbi:MAG: hypothetical protein Q8P53_03285 [Candidatus Shapirobacteria bacterium]|nr:hypothetical protein [Candidatus Shapirobacteria bacterium]
MKDRDILEFSKKTKDDATFLLKNTDLISILKKYGEVIVGGSFKYDIMWGADIDITVVCQNTRKSSLEALNKVIEAKLAQKYEYGDFVTFKREKRPESYILNLILPFNDRKWEIEIWFFNKESNDQKEVDNLMKAKLNEKNKLKILKMKEKRERSGLSKHSLGSFDIYKKILV